MALTERTADDKIEIVGDYKHLQIRQATIIERDGVEISRNFHRRVVGPKDDVSGETAEEKAIAALVHTKSIKDAYQKHIADQSPDVALRKDPDAAGSKAPGAK